MTYYIINHFNPLNYISSPNNLFDKYEIVYKFKYGINVKLKKMKEYVIIII
jgi:hypothetical protein